MGSRGLVYLYFQSLPVPACLIFGQNCFHRQVICQELLIALYNLSSSSPVSPVCYFLFECHPNFLRIPLSKYLFTFHLLSHVVIFTFIFPANLTNMFCIFNFFFLSFSFSFESIFLLCLTFLFSSLAFDNVIPFSGFSMVSSHVNSFGKAFLSLLFFISFLLIIVILCSSLFPCFVFLFLNFLYHFINHFLFHSFTLCSSHFFSFICYCQPPLYFRPSFPSALLSI